MRLPAATFSVLSIFTAFAGIAPVANTSVSLQSATIEPLAIGEIRLTKEPTEPKQQALAVEPTSEAAPEQPTAPERQPIIVDVIKGDSLSKIASAHNTTYKRLFDANAFIVDPDIINPGDKVRIPFEDEVIAERALPAPKPAVVKAPAPNATAAPKRVVATNAPAVADGSVWDRLAACESGGRWNINTGNGYYGGLQFLPSTWRAVGGTGLPHEHSREEQIYRAEILLARSGWGQWPQCARKLGLL